MIKNYKKIRIILIFMLVIVLHSCKDNDSSDSADLNKSINEDASENYSLDSDLDYEESDVNSTNNNTDEIIDNASSDINKVIYYSKDKTISAYVDSVDFSRENSIEVAVEYNGEKVILPLSIQVNSLDDIVFLDDNRIGITGHINPSLSSHEVFDMETGELISSFYGIGFIYDEKYKLYYVVPQPHWVGIDDRGGNLIMNEQGDVLYETEPNIMIYGDLRIESGCIYFYEKTADPNIDNYEMIQKSINVD